jgi:D-alanyl-D-alanine carboxypeptidase/D-alanyl-D-alanine-endopeptidase (penicillin-binding protein 4)
VRPASAPITLRNLARTAPAGRPLAIVPDARGTAISIVGTVDPVAPPATRLTSVANPTLYFATALRDALIANGVRVERYALDGDDYPPIDRTTWTLVAEIQSPPLSEIARTMMAVSQNLFAESLLKTMGRLESGSPGTSATGAAAVIGRLEAWGISRRAVVQVDGSGLSRYNLITPAAQVAVLEHVFDDPRLREGFLGALPIAGTPGTLERRLLGTAAADNARVKTGTFSNARGIAGFVRTRDGEMLAFSIIANNFNAPGVLVDQASDGVIAALAELTR